jgi:hypothetical protein
MVLVCPLSRALRVARAPRFQRPGSHRCHSPLRREARGRDLSLERSTRPRAGQRMAVKLRMRPAAEPGCLCARAALTKACQRLPHSGHHHNRDRPASSRRRVQGKAKGKPSSGSRRRPRCRAHPRWTKATVLLPGSARGWLSLTPRTSEPRPLCPLWILRPLAWSSACQHLRSRRPSSSRQTPRPLSLKG